MNGKRDQQLLLRLCLAGVLLAAGFIAIVAAQGIRGTVGGTIKDQSEAVVPNVIVRLINADKKLEVNVAVTNAQGAFQFLEVEPAVYDVVASAPGFSEIRVTAVKVEPNRNVQLPISLSVSGTTELVTVSAAEILVDRESATLGTTVEHVRIEGLPLDGRNIMNLALLQPGVSLSHNPTAGTATFGEGLGFRVSGGRGVENNITLDGANNNEIAIGSNLGAQPRPDAVEEFRILSSNFEAEFGRNAGSIINVVTKGGGNQFHGNARTFIRPTILSAARYFDKAVPSNTGDLRRRYERKEIGGNFGGPVIIPKLYNGKARTFFFVDYETKRQLIGDTRVVTGLPTTSEIAGNFSALGKQIIDPSTGNAFSGNQIPSNRISPIAKFYLGYVPTADANGRATVSANEITNNEYVTYRVDHQLTNRNMLSFSSNVYDQYVASPFAFYGASVPGFGSADKRRTWNYILRDAHNFSATLTNSLMLAYARNNQPSLAPVNTKTPAEIGFAADFVANPAFAGPPQIQLYERKLVFGNSYQGPQARLTENFQLQDGVAWLHGNHRIKFGFDGTMYRQKQTFLFINQGFFGFSGINSGNSTGDDLADFMIGNTPSDMQFGANGMRDYRQKMVAAFAQDAWKLNQQLTLDLGIRYEYSSPITDLYNRVSYYRFGATSQLLASGKMKDLDGTPIVVPAGGKIPNGLVYVGDPDPILGGTVPAGGIAKDFNNWAPRFGLAYAPKGGSGFLGRILGQDQTVIRTGFGMYYGAVIGDTSLQQLSAPGYGGSTNAYYYPGSGTLANPFGPDPFPNYTTNENFDLDLGQNANPFATHGKIEVTAPLTSTSRPIDPRIRTPYTYQYNLTVERSFGANYVMTLSYVGSRGVKLYAQEQINPAYGTFLKAPAGRTIPTATTGNINTRRVNTDVAGGLTEIVAAGYSNYNALQAQLQRRFNNGLEMQASYTFSKSITDSDTSRDNLDLLDRRQTRGLSSQDTPHRFVTSWIYEPPFAKLLPKVPSRFVNGWSFGGVATFQTGTPFTVNNLYTTDGTGNAVLSYADLGAPFTQVDPRKNNNRAFNSDAFKAFGSSASGFVLARDYRRGTSKPNMFRLQNGINNWNLIVSKTTALWSEGTKMEIRFEMFNAFNHTQFQNADLNLADQARGTFGTFTSAAEPRVIQVAARISF